MQRVFGSPLEQYLQGTFRITAESANALARGMTKSQGETPHEYSQRLGMILPGLVALRDPDTTPGSIVRNLLDQNLLDPVFSDLLRTATDQPENSEAGRMARVALAADNTQDVTSALRQLSRLTRVGNVSFDFTPPATTGIPASFGETLMEELQFLPTAQRDVAGIALAEILPKLYALALRLPSEEAEEQLSAEGLTASQQETVKLIQRWTDPAVGDLSMHSPGSPMVTPAQEESKQQALGLFTASYSAVNLSARAKRRAKRLIEAGVLQDALGVSAPSGLFSAPPPSPLWMPRR